MISLLNYFYFVPPDAKSWIQRGWMRKMVNFIQSLRQFMNVLIGHYLQYLDVINIFHSILLTNLPTDFYQKYWPVCNWCMCVLLFKILTLILLLFFLISEKLLFKDEKNKSLNNKYFYSIYRSIDWLIDWRKIVTKVYFWFYAVCYIFYMGNWQIYRYGGKYQCHEDWTLKCQARIFY